jgi:glycosyltransferase involved in cell wall biosynthesis
MEIIVCDDKSIDNTVEILKSYTDPRIKIVLNEQNKGHIGNYNTAIFEAKGKYLKLQCADDLITTDCIEKEVAVFLENTDKNLVMVTSEKRVINEKGEILFKKPFPGKAGFHIGIDIIKKTARYGTNIIGEPGAPLLLTAAVHKAGGITIPKELNYLTENDLWCRMLQHGNLFVVKEPLFLYRIVETSDSVKSQRWKQAKVYNKWVREYVDKKLVELSFFDKMMAFLSAWLLCIARNVVYVFANKKLR